MDVNFESLCDKSKRNHNLLNIKMFEYVPVLQNSIWMFLIKNTPDTVKSLQPPATLSFLDDVCLSFLLIGF